VSAPPTATGAVRWLERKIVYSVGFGVVLMLALGAGLLYYRYSRQTSTRVVRIAYGSGGPVCRHFLEQMALHGRDRGLDIRLVVTEGTAETINLIEKGETDLGLATGAIEDASQGSVLEITPLYMEPLQMLVTEELYDAISRDFSQLRGKSIALDARLSATNLLATELLSFMGLVDPPGTPQFSPVYIQQPDLLAITDPAALPQVIFQIGGLPSQTIRQMIVNHRYRLVALPFGASFNLEKFQAADRPNLVAGTALRVDRAFVEEFVIPAFSYSVLPPVPPEDTRTVASRLLLLGSRNVDDQTVRKILDLLFSPEISDLVRPALTVDLLDTGFQFQRHPGTVRYVDAMTPIDVEGAFTNYGRLVEVWGLAIALYVAAAKGLKLLRQRQGLSKRSAGDFLEDVLAVEVEATSTASHDDRVRLDQRLTDIKKTAIEMHLAETLDDAESLPSLLVAVADARTRIWGPVA
jgi:TRAP-type uncharacterized transport system substrate-binding protein